MTDAQSPDTVPGQETVAPTTKQEELEALVDAHLAVGNSGILLHPDHPGYMKPPAGVAVSAPAISQLGSTAFQTEDGVPNHRHTIAGYSESIAPFVPNENTIGKPEVEGFLGLPNVGGTLLPHTWKREAAFIQENSIGSAWEKAIEIFFGEGDGITQLENVNLRIITAASSITGFFQLRIVRYSTSLLTSMNATILQKVENDYRLNVRDRVIPVFNNASLYESRLGNFRLRDSEKLEAWVRAAPSSGLGSKYSGAVTFSFREADKGDI